MKICYIPTLNFAVVHWRIENYAREIVRQAEHKCYVDYLRYDDKAWDSTVMQDTEEAQLLRDRLDAAFNFFDIIIFQKIQFKPALEWIAKLKVKYPKTKIFAEIDDAIGSCTPSNLDKDRLKQADQWAAEHCAMSDGVICSTEYLANSVKMFNENTYVAPNCISETWFKVTKSEVNESDVFNIGYVGGGGHDEDLLIAYRALCLLRKLHPEQIFTFVVRYGGSRPDYLLDEDWIDFKQVRWKIDEYPQKLYDLNISVALAPLRDTEFNRCKSNLKFLEWSYLNVPVLASNVEAFKNVPCTKVENDINKWVHALMKGPVFPYPNKDDCLSLFNIEKETRNLLLWLNKNLEDVK